MAVSTPFPLVHLSCACEYKLNTLFEQSVATECHSLHWQYLQLPVECSLEEGIVKCEHYICMLCVNLVDFWCKINCQGSICNNHKRCFMIINNTIVWNIFHTCDFAAASLQDSSEVVCRVGEHQHRWHIDVQNFTHT